MDDASLVESISLQEVLKPRQESCWTRPLPWRSRHELALPDNLSETTATLGEMVKFAKENFMEINKKKTKVILFNPRRRGLDFQPEVKLEGEILYVIQQIRLVGLILTDNLFWRSNTDSLVKRAYAKLWIIRRLKAMGAAKSTLRLIYFQHI